MGQYFRKWLEKEELFPEDYRPEDDEVRIYANSKQRTIATANFFKTGLLPVADTEVEYHADYDTMDPVFEPKITFVTDEYGKSRSLIARELRDALCASPFAQLCDPPEAQSSTQALNPC